jgi:hypothetical protein
MTENIKTYKSNKIVKEKKHEHVSMAIEKWH